MSKGGIAGAAETVGLVYLFASISVSLSADRRLYADPSPGREAQPSRLIFGRPSSETACSLRVDVRYALLKLIGGLRHPIPSIRPRRWSSCYRPVISLCSTPQGVTSRHPCMNWRRSQAERARDSP